MMNEIEIVVDDSDFDVTASAESADSAVEIQVGAADGGTPGENGATFYPSVSADGMLSWTNDKGLSNPEPVSIKGDKGDQGPAYTLTEADKQDMVAAVLAALPVYGGEVAEV